MAFVLIKVLLSRFVALILADLFCVRKPAALNKRSELVEVHGTHMRS